MVRSIVHAAPTSSSSHSQRCEMARTHSNQCMGIECQHYKDSGQETKVRWIKTANGTCQKCSSFDKLVRMVSAAENGIRHSLDDSVYMDIENIKKMKQDRRLDEVIKIARKARGGKAWKRTKANKESQESRNAARRLANTLLIKLNEVNEGPDSAMNQVQVTILEAKSRRTCNGECMALDNGDEEDGLCIACPTCTHLRRNWLSDPTRCLSCCELIEKDESNPCRKCKTHWLLENNSIKSRLEQAKKNMQEESRPEKRQRTDGIENDENTSPVKFNASFTSVLTKPVGKPLTATQQRNRTCRKVGLPLKASPSKVKETT